MAKQVINIGATPNDKSGDPLRTAFIKVNDNFTELYNTTGADVQIPIQTGQEGKFLRTNGSTLSWVAITASNQLVNGNKTVSLGSDGNLTFPDGSFQSTAFVGLASTAQDLYKNEEIFIGIGDGLTTRKQWSFDPSGTITVPSPTSTVFTLTFAESNYVPTISKPTLTLTSTPWELHGEYVYTTDGRVAPLALDNIFPVLVNPGYTSGDAFTFDESIHGFAGYTLTVTLTDVVLPGGAGWTANIEMNDPPAYPSTVNSNGAIKVTSNENSWTFGTDGRLTLPDALYVTNGLDGAIIGTNGVRIIANHANPLSLEWNLSGETNIFADNPALNTDNARIEFGINGFTVVVNNPTSGSSWTFGPDGKLRLPNGAVVTDQTSTELFEFYNVEPVNIVGSGTGCYLHVSYNAGDTDYQVTVSSGGGFSYNLGDQLKVSGDLLGGTTPANDLIVLVTGLLSSAPSIITTVDIISGAPKAFPTGLHIQSGSNEWTFGDTGVLTFPDNLTVNDGVIGKATTNITVVEDIAGTTTSTHTVESQIEITTTDIVIAKRTIDTVDDGVVSATDSTGSVIELTQSNASIKHYLEPAGPNNTVYSQFTTDGGSAVIETIEEDVGGTAYGRVNATVGSVDVFAKDTIGSGKQWRFDNDGSLILPPGGNVSAPATPYSDLVEIETIYNNLEVTYQDALTDWMSVESFRPVWYALPGRTAYDLIMGWSPTTGQPELPVNLPQLAKNAKDAYAEWQNAISISGLKIKADTANFEFDSTGKLKLSQGGVIGGGDPTAVQAAYDAWQATEDDWTYLITDGGIHLEPKPWTYAAPDQRQATVLAMWQVQQQGGVAIDWTPITADFYNQVRTWLAVNTNSTVLYNEWKKLSTSVNITSEDSTWTFTNDSAITFPDGLATLSVDSTTGFNINILDLTDTLPLVTWNFDRNGYLNVPGVIGFNDNGIRRGSMSATPNSVQIVAEDGKGIDLWTDDGGAHWLFGTNGTLTLPVGGDILDSTGTSVLGGGGGIVGITSSSTSTYNVSTSFTPPNGDWNYANWDDLRDIGGFTPNALFYSVLKSLNPGDTVVVNGTDSYIIDHVTTGVGNNGYFHILTTTDSLNRFAQITSLTFDIVDVAVSGNVTIESTLIIDGNIRLKAGADIKNSAGDSALVSREPSFEIVISSFTAQAGRRYGVNTTAGAITAYLPIDPVAGDAIFFVDSHGTFSTNNLTIDGNSGWPYAKTIMGQATQVIATDGLSFGLFYNGTEWRFYS